MRKKPQCGRNFNLLSRAYNGRRSNAVTRVERVENGITVEYTEQEELERVVREMTQHRFTMADSSPLCNGLLGDQLGYFADTDTAIQILEGTFEPPPELETSQQRSPAGKFG